MVLPCFQTASDPQRMDSHETYISSGASSSSSKGKTDLNWYSKCSRRMSKKASSINRTFGSSISSGCSTRKTTSTSDERDGGSAGDAGRPQRVVVLMVATAGRVRKRRRWRRWRLHPAELLTVKSTATEVIDPIIGSLEIPES